ncbi:hypothetical protein [Phosphitispora sp. TUW77]|uniref:hypothetical protein n=1 Tax=Phosphitispora sp. TUW77 TaxID=3152361 RepID=UPI003AB17BB8
MAIKTRTVIIAEAKKISIALATWGFGIITMVAYCVLLYWLQRGFGIYVSMVGAVLFLIFAFFVIDLWYRLPKKHE